jgi:hypothetical protein
MPWDSMHKHSVEDRLGVKVWRWKRKKVQSSLEASNRSWATKSVVGELYAY